MKAPGEQSPAGIPRVARGTPLLSSRKTLWRLSGIITNAGHTLRSRIAASGFRDDDLI